MTIGSYTPEEAISSIATALAPAALGIVRLSGKNCIELVSKVFSRPKALLAAPGNTLVYGWIQEGGESQTTSLRSDEVLVGSSTLKTVEPITTHDPRKTPKRIDEVMLAVYRAPKSFTGEDMVEIFCHGGPAVVTAIQTLMLKSGFRQALRGEYTFRAYINGKTDLTKAEAVKEIIDSHTDAGRSHAVGRLSGSLFEEIDSIKKLIIDTLASIEVEIEYPEDEETIADTFDRKDIELARDRLQTLADSWKGEKLYQDGARVVLAGRTNAGKSSLFNAILKEERAIVSDIEGTTRDWLESWASINGIPVRLFDTAGLRETDDVIEAQGVELSRNLASDADVVLYLIDSTTKPTAEDEEFIKNCKEPLIVVWTKSDKNQAGGVAGVSPAERVAEDGLPAAARGILPPPLQVQISSKTGTGIPLLFAQIAKILTSGLTTDREQAGLGSARQRDSVAEALENVKHALISADDNYTLDAVVQDLEEALDCLGEVTGDVTPDDVLGSIFANFCVGK
ncbi:tRNA modification GTPase TrmE [Treponema sp. JC4]|uniref:tRNA uridine-5-carboxymethylaminomethyl(34) synthesis GTPase MnmE n=1 Tax=Treponema sp. JC4 TaxID=1124982 RepID=UPI00025B0E43|nr:tRNA uridine-5-carboxymethylaminomethyl(34) synthesis GTPase MnmE [Treponema sp. JC4]EID84568.1 tRNA modification GTPase TrmE [Treponema sp. JC4]